MFTGLKTGTNCGELEKYLKRINADKMRDQLGSLARNVAMISIVSLSAERM